MFGRLSHTRLLRYAGLFTWALVGVPLAYTSFLLEGRPDLSQPPGMSWQGWLAYGLFGVLYWRLTRAMDGRRIRSADYVLLVLMTGSAIAVSYYSLSGLGSILLMVVACVLPWLLPLSLGIAALLLSQFAIAPVYVMGQDFDLAAALMQSVLYAGFCGFIFVTSLVARQQAQARDDLRRLNSELRATRALLAESSRIAERMRIARDLHDLIGHHLTALSLNLEVASHLCNEAAATHVRSAQSTARHLLADVREAVSELRQDDAIDLTQALHSLTDSVPGLNVHVVMPPRFSVEDPRRAQVLLRCAQEIITNTAKHAGARNLWLNFAYADASLVGLHARDDGRGAERVEPGNGLSGMRERLTELGGSLSLEAGMSQGFALTVRLPLGEQATLAHAPTRFEPPALNVSP